MSGPEQAMKREAGATADARAREADAGARSAEGAVEIDAPAERVWRALTDAAELQRWFPLEARVEPGAGGRIHMSWQNEFVGDMRITVWDPPRHLQTTWRWDAEGHGGDAAAAQVTDYWLESAGSRTRVRVVTSGFPDDPSWDAWVEGTSLGWHFELRQLKHYLERHEGRERRVVYLRRRVPLSRDAAWARLFGPGGLPARPLGGQPFDDRPPKQYAAIVADPPGAMLRVTLEPALQGDDRPDVTLWLSAWDGAAERMAAIRDEWSALLERLFPEGEPPPARP